MRRIYKHREYICNHANEHIFKKQCLAIEKHITNLEIKSILEDVDGSLLKIYRHKKGEIKVVNDCDTDIIYIDSDFDIEPYFAKSRE